MEVIWKFLELHLDPAFGTIWNLFGHVFQYSEWWFGNSKSKFPSGDLEIPSATWNFYTRDININNGNTQKLVKGSAWLYVMMFHNFSLLHICSSAVLKVGMGVYIERESFSSIRAKNLWFLSRGVCLFISIFSYSQHKM